MSNSIEFGKPKMSVSIGIGKRNEKPCYIRYFLFIKKWLLDLAHFVQVKNTFKKDLKYNARDDKRHSDLAKIK